MGGSTGTARRRTWVWVTMDAEEVGGVIGVWCAARKPKPTDNGCWCAGWSDVEFFDEPAADLFGLSLKPGTCQKVQFSAKVVK